MLVGFTAWLLGLALQRRAVDQDPMAARPSLQSRYWVFPRSIEWLRRRCWPPPLAQAVCMVMSHGADAHELLGKVRYHRLKPALRVVGPRPVIVSSSVPEMTAACSPSFPSTVIGLGCGYVRKYGSGASGIAMRR